MITLFDKFKKKNKKSTIFSVGDYIYVLNFGHVGIITDIADSQYQVLVDDIIYNYNIDSVDKISTQTFKLMTPEQVEQYKLEQDLKKYNL